MGDALVLGLYPGVGGVLGYVVGAWLGKKFGWGTNGQLVGVLLGVAAGMYLMIKEAIRLNKD
jgi:zinc transporter ZupT